LHYRTPADRVEEEAREMRRSLRFPLLSLLLGLIAFGLGYFGDRHQLPVLALAGFVLMVVAVASGGAWVLWRWIRLMRNVVQGYKD
jgi:hypothetical protein